MPEEKRAWGARESEYAIVRVGKNLSRFLPQLSLSSFRFQVERTRGEESWAKEVGSCAIWGLRVFFFFVERGKAAPNRAGIRAKKLNGL